MRVLIVEDDPELAGLLRDGLRAQRIDPTLAATFAEGRDRAHAGSFDVIILDVRLPGGTGFDLCGELRHGGSTTPVLMLTALDALDDRVRGLEAGADDYLTKPFAFRELLARIQALARRRPALSPARHQIADLEVDLGTRQVQRRGRPITLSAKEFALRSEEHTSELQSRSDLVCRLLLEKKKRIGVTAFDYEGCHNNMLRHSSGQTSSE